MGRRALADTTGTTPVQSASTAAEGWYGVPAEEAVKRLAVDPAVGLSGGRVAELLERDGANELPAEKPVPGWKRLLHQYRSYMQMILVGGGDRVADDQAVEHRAVC